MSMHPDYSPLYHVMDSNSTSSSSNCRHRQMNNGWCPRFAQHDTTPAMSGAQVSLWVSVPEFVQINQQTQKSHEWHRMFLIHWPISDTMQYQYRYRSMVVISTGSLHWQRSSRRGVTRAHPPPGNKTAPTFMCHYSLR